MRVWLIRNRVLLLVPFLLSPGTGIWAQEAEEKDPYDRVVDQFILYDIGELRGEAASRARSEFYALDDEQAIPALVRGVNRAARIRASCPIIMVANKLQGLIQTCKDRELLQYAIDHLDSSGPDVHYGSYVDSLREAAQTALNGSKLVRRLSGGTPSQLRRARKPIEDWSFEDLEEAVYQEEGTQLISVLEELMKRKGGQHTQVLANAIQTVPDDTKELARGLLAQRLSRMTDRTLLAMLESPNVEVRSAAVRAIGYKGTRLYAPLAAAMRDAPMVADHAHQALVKLSGQDLGPEPGSSATEWYYASKRWEKWAEQQKATGDGAPKQ